MAADQQDADWVQAEKASASAYLKDALAVLLEVRPADPLRFLCAYFKRAANPDDPASLAWYLIRACPRSRPCFRDNVYSAYTTLVQSSTLSGGTAGGAAEAASEGAPAAECNRLLHELLHPLPEPARSSLGMELRLGGSRGSRLVSFEEFAIAVDACVAAEEALEESARVFGICDQTGEGCLHPAELVQELQAVKEAAAMSGNGDLAWLPPLDSLRDHFAASGSPETVTAEDFFAALWHISHDVPSVG